MSKKMIELIIHLIKKFKLIDSVLIFMIIIIKGWQISTLWFIKAKN